MKKRRFDKMSPEEFAASRPQSEDEISAYEQEANFRAWCKENEQDPTDDAARESYSIIQRECGNTFWDDLDEDEREGWIHNIRKSFDD